MTILSNIIIWLGIIFIIYWAIKKYRTKKNGQKYEKQYYPIIIGLVLLIMGSIINPVKTTKTTTETDINKVSSSVTKKAASSKHSNVIKEASSKNTTSKSSASSSSLSNQSSSSSLNYSKVEYGMTMDEVINAIGVQPTDRDDYTLYYGDEDFDFNENKLIGASVKSVQDKIDAKFKADQQSEKKQREEQDSLKYQAQYFGQKDVETLQKMSSTYKSTRIDNGMMYTFHFNNDMLIRVDTDDGYTTVYKYDENTSDGLGDKLYSGKTIMQKEKRPYYFYN